LHYVFDGQITRPVTHSRYREKAARMQPGGSSIIETYNMKLRVILADDHPFVLLGLHATLAAAGGIEVVGEANSAGALVRLLDTVPCDVVVTDLTMPDDPDGEEDGLQLVQRLRRDWPALRVIVLTSVTNATILRAVMDAGAAATFRKSDSLDELVSAVRGASRASASVLGVVHVGRAQTPEAGDQPVSAVSRLSPRESEVIREVVHGRSITEIARSLGRDVRTVSRQKRDAMAKLGVSNAPGLFAFVRAHGFS
jgi:two-component system, NarL family, captular synthesis response regulator RcsB